MYFLLIFIFLPHVLHIMFDFCWKWWEAVYYHFFCWIVSLVIFDIINLLFWLWNIVSFRSQMGCIWSSNIKRNFSRNKLHQPFLNDLCVFFSDNVSSALICFDFTLKLSSLSSSLPLTRPKARGVQLWGAGLLEAKNISDQRKKERNLLGPIHTLHIHNFFFGLSEYDYIRLYIRKMQDSFGQCA